MKPQEWATNEDVRLRPEGITSVSLSFLSYRFIFDYNRQAYLYLVNQDRSTWTWELDRELAWLLILGKVIVLI